MEHQSDPCASIPKTHVSVDLVRCHHHQAWTMTLHTYHEDAEITSDVAHCTVVHFGPFDGVEDVLRALSGAVAAAALAHSGG